MKRFMYASIGILALIFFQLGAMAACDDNLIAEEVLSFSGPEHIGDETWPGCVPEAPSGLSLSLPFEIPFEPEEAYLQFEAAQVYLDADSVLINGQLVDLLQVGVDDCSIYDTILSADVSPFVHAGANEIVITCDQTSGNYDDIWIRELVITASPCSSPPGEEVLSFAGPEHIGDETWPGCIPDTPSGLSLTLPFEIPFEPEQAYLQLEAAQVYFGGNSVSINGQIVGLLAIRTDDCAVYDTFFSADVSPFVHAGANEIVITCDQESGYYDDIWIRELIITASPEGSTAAEKTTWSQLKSEFK
ncbi:MAG: hypothetical protein KAW17_11365 [Candidatus Eisenbacteria sp.]|nr:hypothetical protein [Candidatus Eisenbacteria bacterium]